MDATTADVLRAHLRAMAAERREDWPYFGLMFPTPDGMPFTRWALLREFRSACERAGIRPRRFHDLRHTSMTLLAELGVPEDVRMARAGQSQKATQRGYAHAGDAQDRAASERLAEAIG